MISLAPGVCNRLWMLSSLGAWRGFQEAAQDPREAQLRRLRSILRRNAGSEYGVRFGFGGIRTAAEYRRRVPVVRYDDLAPEMEAIRKGREGVLTTEPVHLLQPSSGSTAATKLIPYTASLRRELNRAVSVWMGDLFWNRPELLDGPAYWSVSPLPAEGLAGAGAGTVGLERGVGPGASDTSEEGGAPETPGSRRVGFDEDAAYLGGLTRSVVAGALAVPGEVGRISDPAVHRYVTLRYLLAAPEVRILSVWSPTFLALLLEPMAGWWDRLVEDVEGGKLRVPGNGGGVDGIGLPPIPPDPRRARELRAVGPEDLPGIWPRLGLLSAWADGASAPYAEELRRSFPGVPFQPKGLIATEAFLTIPRWNLPGAHPAITSHFLEFLPEGAGPEETLLVDELKEGGRYEIVLTTGGGLYRYRLGDVVEVVAEAGGLPCLRFVGRADRVSDRFGEKLSDGFVTRALQELCAEEELDPTFSLLAPEDENGRTRYVWYVDSVRESPLPKVSRKLDEALSENFHYAQCRRLGQLAPAELSLVPPGAALRYLERKGRNGRRLGDVKIPALETETGWGDVLGIG
jgi:hypothetical protein